LIYHNLQITFALVRISPKNTLNLFDNVENVTHAQSPRFGVLPLGKERKPDSPTPERDANLGKIQRLILDDIMPLKTQSNLNHQSPLPTLGMGQLP
jgi:hypothetical protein